MGGLPRHQHFALYGNVILQREYCPTCRGHAFVIDGKLACCGTIVDFDSHRSKRMTLAEDRRRRPTVAEAREILALQENRCLYCQHLFGTPIVKDGRIVTLKINFDHVVPFSYSQNNYAYNFVAACHVCNGMKGSSMFSTVEEARVYLQSLWRLRHIDAGLAP